MRPVLVGVAAVALVALSGCGMDVLQNDDVDPQADTVRAGLATLYADHDTSAAVVAESTCFADALLDRLSLDQLVAAGLVEDDGQVTAAAPVLDVDVAGAWVDAADSCVPYAEVSARAAAVGSPGLDEAAYVACLEDAVAPDRVREALVATLSGDYSSDPAVADLTAAEARCAP